MKLKFKNQDFQNDAVETVARLFKGQEKATSALGKSAQNKGLVDKNLKRKKRKYKLPLFKLVILTR